MGAPWECECGRLAAPLRLAEVTPSAVVVDELCVLVSVLYVLIAAFVAVVESVSVDILCEGLWHKFFASVAAVECGCHVCSFLLVKHYYCTVQSTMQIEHKR